MANFEGLIKQALATQNAEDSSVRERIYQSSRKALLRMLEKTPNLDDEAVQNHVNNLENSIEKIEAGFTPAPVEPQSDEVNQPELPTQDQAVETPSMPEPERERVETPLAPEPQPEVKPAPVQFSRPSQNDPRINPIDAPRTLRRDEANTPVKEAAKTAGDTSDSKPASRTPDPAPIMPAPVIPQRGALPSTNTSPPSAPIKPQPVQQELAETSQVNPAPVLDDVLNADEYEPTPLFRPEPGPSSVSLDDIRPSISDEAPVVNREQPSLAPQASATRPVNTNLGELDDFESSQTARAPEFVEPFLGDIRQENEASFTGDNELDNFDLDSGDFGADRETLRTYKRKNPLLRRIWPILLALAIVLVILWILYALFATMPSDNGQARNVDTPGPVGESQTAADGTISITLLEPTDLSALVTAGRGSAELINEQNNQMLRLQSIRQGSNGEASAEPILLELEKGVLQQILNKEVTVEVYAKSGLSGPAQFAVECDIGGASACGRKRFRVGLQPERIVFALDLSPEMTSDARAFLAINTDVTNAATSSGQGDAIDIIYVRLRLSDKPA